MTTSLVPDTSLATASMDMVGSAIVPIDKLFVAFYSFRTDISVPVLGTTLDFSLKSLSRPLYAAVLKTQKDVCGWVGAQPDPMHLPGLRQHIQDVMFGGYVSTSVAFRDAANTIATITMAIGPGGPSTAQREKANAAFAKLDGIVSGAASAIADLQTQFTAFQATIDADMACLQDGPAAIGNVIATIPQDIVNWFKALDGPAVGSGTVLKMLEHYGDAYASALRKLQTEMNNSRDAGTAAATAMISVATQWDTFAQVTKDAAQAVSEAQAGGLTDTLTALETGAAANEWIALGTLATNISHAMSTEGILGATTEIQL